MGRTGECSLTRSRSHDVRVRGLHDHRCGGGIPCWETAAHQGPDGKRACLLKQLASTHRSEEAGPFDTEATSVVSQIGLLEVAQTAFEALEGHRESRWSHAVELREPNLPQEPQSWTLLLDGFLAEYEYWTSAKAASELLSYQAASIGSTEAHQRAWRESIVEPRRVAIGLGTDLQVAVGSLFFGLDELLRHMTNGAARRYSAETALGNAERALRDASSLEAKAKRLGAGEVVYEPTS